MAGHYSRLAVACNAGNDPATLPALSMCNLYSITTSQAAIIALFRVINRYVGNLPLCLGSFLTTPQGGSKTRSIIHK
jgi:hypothetical protein